MYIPSNCDRARSRWTSAYRLDSKQNILMLLRNIFSNKLHWNISKQNVHIGAKGLKKKKRIHKYVTFAKFYFKRDQFLVTFLFDLFFSCSAVSIITKARATEMARAWKERVSFHFTVGLQRVNSGASESRANHIARDETYYESHATEGDEAPRLSRENQSIVELSLIRCKIIMRFFYSLQSTQTLTMRESLSLSLTRAAWKPLFFFYSIKRLYIAQSILFLISISHLEHTCLPIRSRVCEVT